MLFLCLCATLTYCFICKCHDLRSAGVDKLGRRGNIHFSGSCTGNALVDVGMPSYKESLGFNVASAARLITFRDL